VHGKTKERKTDVRDGVGRPQESPPEDKKKDIRSDGGKEEEP